MNEVCAEIGNFVPSVSSLTPIQERFHHAKPLIAELIAAAEARGRQQAQQARDALWQENRSYEAALRGEQGITFEDDYEVNVAALREERDKFERNWRAVQHDNAYQREVIEGQKALSTSLGRENATLTQALKDVYIQLQAEGAETCISCILQHIDEALDPDE